MRKNTCRAFSGPVALLVLLFAPLCSHRHSPHQLGWKFWHNQIMTKLWVKNFEAVSESLFLPLNFLFHLFAIEVVINSTCLCFFSGGKKASILTRNNLNAIFVVCLLGEDEAEVPRSPCNNPLTAVS